MKTVFPVDELEVSELPASMGLWCLKIFSLLTVGHFRAAPESTTPPPQGLLSAGCLSTFASPYLASPRGGRCGGWYYQFSGAFGYSVPHICFLELP